MKFNRDLYLQKLISASKNDMIKIVTGIRRCGKSYLLFEIFRNYLLSQGVAEDHIIGLALDDNRNKDLRNPDKLLEYIDSQLIQDGQTSYVILDEVQMVDDFVGVLLSMTHMRNVQTYVSGSNSRFLSKDVVTEFRGRGWEIRVRPLSFAEYLEGVGGDKRDALEDYYTYGGLPAVAKMETPEEKEAIELIATQKPYSKLKSALIGALGGGFVGATQSNNTNRIGSSILGAVLGGGTGALSAHILNKKEEKARREAIRQLEELNLKGYNEFSVSKKRLKELNDNKDKLTNTEMELLNRISSANK